MEASEAGHDAKARALSQHFQSSFLHFIITSHPANLPGESRGKGSNVAWAARSACQELQALGLDKNRIILTIMDSDAWVPEAYISQVERNYLDTEDPHSVIFVPPMIFSRNAREVPAAVRVTDITWSAMVMQNLQNSRGVSFPCSVYSLTLTLAERVGFWDTDADAVGEDLHMWLKCFFKTDGLVRSIPIFVPINLTNVQTRGYIGNLYARYVQASRHYNGVADVAYTLRSAFRGTQKRGYSLVQEGEATKSGKAGPYSGKLKNRSHKRFSSIGSVTSVTSVNTGLQYLTQMTGWMDKIVVVFHVLEAHMIPATSGWLMFAAVPLMQIILWPPWSKVSLVPPANNPVLTSEFFGTMWNLVKIITVFLPLPTLGMLIVYEHLHRVVDRELFRKAPSESRTWKDVKDYIWLPVSAWLFMTIPSTVGCLKRLWKYESAYHVSEKLFDEDMYRH